LITLQYKITSIQQSIIQTVLYFDVFNYPLTSSEVYENSAIHIPFDVFLQELDQLIQHSFLKTSGNFILTINASETIIKRRLHGNKEAQNVFPTAYRYSEKIGRFPFVEGVCLSGALSKNYYDEQGDIDFFIITKPGRLWICRTLLILRYKLLPKHKKKYWCINYLISSDNMVIGEKNAFAGTEIAYLIPTVNYSVYQKFLQSNEWYKSRFPNKIQLSDKDCVTLPSPLFKKVFEKILNAGFGAWIDDALLRITLKHWLRKYPEMKTEDFELQFRSRKTVCKRHTHGYQNIVLKKWEDKQRAYETLLNIKFT